MLSTYTDTIHFPRTCAYCGGVIHESNYACTERVNTKTGKVVRDICTKCQPFVETFWQDKSEPSHADTEIDLPGDFFDWLLFERGIELKLEAKAGK